MPAKKALGSDSRIAYVVETVKGTTPASGTLYEIQKSAETFDRSQEREYDPDISNDGQHTATVANVATLPGGWTCALSHEALNDHIPQLLGRSDWTTSAISIVGAITVTNSIGTFTASNTPDLSPLVVGAVVALSNTTDNNDDYQILSVDDAGDIFTFQAFRDDQGDPEAEAGIVAGLVTQIACHCGGKDFGSISVEKHLGVFGEDNSFLVFKGQQPDSLNIALVPGGGIIATMTHKGLSMTVADNGIFAPYDYTVHADNAGNTTLTAGEDTVVVNSTGTNNFAVDQKFWFEGDEVEREVVSIAAATYAFKFTPIIETGTTIANATKLFVGSVATVRGSDVRFEQNLGYGMIDGSSVVIPAWDVTISNNSTEEAVLFQGDPDSIEVADKTVTGTMEMHVNTTEVELMKKIRAGTSFPGCAVAVDLNDKVFGWTMQSINGSPKEPQIAGPGVLKNTIAYKALKDSTYNTYITFFRTA